MGIWGTVKDAAAAPFQPLSEVGGEIGGLIGGEKGKKVGSTLGAFGSPYGPIGGLFEKDGIFSDLFGKKQGPEMGVPASADYSSDIARTKEELAKMAEKARAKENELRGAMVSQAGLASQAIDKQLSALIDQTGYITGLQNQAISTQQANAGLLRSGLTGERLAGSEFAKQSTIAGLQSTAQLQKADVGSQVMNATKAIAQQRQEVDAKLLALELGSYSDAQFQQQAQDIKIQFGNFINGLETSARNKQDLYNILGGVGTLAGFGIGTMYGAPTKSTTGNDTVPNTDFAGNLSQPELKYDSGLNKTYNLGG